MMNEGYLKSEFVNNKLYKGIWSVKKFDGFIHAWVLKVYFLIISKFEGITGSRYLNRSTRKRSMKNQRT